MGKTEIFIIIRRLRGLLQANLVKVVAQCLPRMRNHKGPMTMTSWTE